MENKYYKAYRIIDGKPRFVIVNESGNVINRSPTKEELTGLEKETIYNQDTTQNRLQYTNEELLEYLRRFYKRNGRSPTEKDFHKNPKYPSIRPYVVRFGSWFDALKLVGLDVESMVKNGVVETCYQKARLAEILIRDHFKNPSIDLAGGNKNSHCDGICPGDKTYDVKSSKFFKYEGRHIFNFKNVYKDKIELLYLLGFNDNYTELMYSWRVPAWKFIDTDTFAINALNGDFTIDNMKEYLITDEIKDVFNKYGYFEKIRNYKITRVKGHEIYK